MWGYYYLCSVPKDVREEEIFSGLESVTKEEEMGYRGVLWVIRREYAHFWKWVLF